MKASVDNLRLHLRAATASAHDRLDSAMREAADWRSRDGYARFLALQHAARRPLEDWIAQGFDDDCAPPPQAPLIASDLAALGAAPAQGIVPFEHASRSRAAQLGIAWALAGSALGNRAIAREIGADWPAAFLTDGAMFAFWQTLRAAIEQPASADERRASSAGALAVFSHFAALAEQPFERAAPAGLAAAPEPAKECAL
ncbi:biliverdin-producing heme oxygenase [Qipengyuania nanhaisediminis]|uniref:biliverdin-producing heme oxygenase n=1 Tax=Qipengyuania nanhaisediminis TaxID=604088 RepID=UPI0038B241F9